MKLSVARGLWIVGESQRLPASSEFPDAVAAGVELGADIGVDQIGFARGDRRLDRVAEIAGAVDADASTPQGGRAG